MMAVKGVGRRVDEAARQWLVPVSNYFGARPEAMCDQQAGYAREGIPEVSNKEVVMI